MLNKCKNCGKEIITSNGRAYDIKRFFCCRDCYWKSMKGVVPENEMWKLSSAIKKGKKGAIWSEDEKKKASITMKNNPLCYWNGKKRPEISGVNHPKYKGGLPKCSICSKELKNRKATRCMSCVRKDPNYISKITKHLHHASGDKHYNWKGGVTSDDEKVRKSVEYKIWRLSVYERDNFTCQMPGCGVRGGRLNAHHIETFSKKTELRTKIDNGITLCTQCHKIMHFKEKQFENMFKEIIKNKLKMV